MRTRHSVGGVRKQRGRYIGLWYEQGVKKSRVLGFVKEMTKGDAREAVAKIVAEVRQDNPQSFGGFVANVYFPFYFRKWKHSTKDNNVNRVNTHLVAAFGQRDIASFRRDELQDFLDSKAEGSFSLVNHLRFDLRQIFGMAVAEGIIRLNPALLLFTPREAKRPTRRRMTLQEVALALQALSFRERVIAKLAVIAGMRPGEIFGARWRDVGETFVEVRERVYRGVLDSPKSARGYRQVALPEGLRVDLIAWRGIVANTNGDAFVFPSERGTPLGKNNVWNRYMLPKLEKIGLQWANFQCYRRTFLTLVKANGGDAKVAADQCGHDIGVSLREYVQAPLESKLALVNSLEKLIK
jgi:integrase